jgi:ankyrin repeat protein
MEPTEALFDAINRGDIASARDAINRGADMNGVNILGMTPMELSVDLGRNDISFLLLSNRGEDSGRGSRAVGRDASASPPAHAPAGKVAQGASRPSAVGKPVPNKAAQAMNIPVAAKPVATPKLFANDGGTPLPSAGFLGFDSRSTAN